MINSVYLLDSQLDFVLKLIDIDDEDLNPVFLRCLLSKCGKNINKKRSQDEETTLKRVS